MTYSNTLNNVFFYPNSFQGQFKMTHDGKQLIATGIDSSLTKEGCSFIYDFDNSTGRISNRRVLLKFEDVKTYYSNSTIFKGNFFNCEISPNDSFIYLLGIIGESNLNSGGTWSSSIVQINRYSLLNRTFKKYPYMLLGLQLGPDAKIYTITQLKNPATISCFTKPNNH
jgi:hypothetical protein